MIFKKLCIVEFNDFFRSKSKPDKDGQDISTNGKHSSLNTILIIINI